MNHPIPRTSHIPHEFLDFVIDVHFLIWVLVCKGPQGGVANSEAGRRKLPVGHSGEAVPSILDHGCYYRQGGGDRRGRGGVIAVARGGRKAIATVSRLRGRRGRRRRGCEVVRGGSAGVGRGGGVAAIAVIDAGHRASSMGVPVAEFLHMLSVQPVEGVQGVQDLLLCHAAPTYPLQQVDLLNSKTRLICIMGHSAKKKRESCCIRELMLEEMLIKHNKWLHSV